MKVNVDIENVSSYEDIPDQNMFSPMGCQPLCLIIKTQQKLPLE